MIVSSKVTAAFNGLSIVEYLTQRFTYLPAVTWLELVNEGRINCNGISGSARTIVSQGDTIQCNLPAFEPPEVNLDYTIVYEDEWLLGVNKPAGLRVHSSGKFVNANLVYHLRHVRLPAYPDVDLVHRLDADTSGLVILARDKAVLAHLVRQFAEGRVKKRYLAVVEGVPEADTGTISLPLGPIKDARVPRHGVDRTAGKAAVTHFKVSRKLSPRYTLLELMPETGRTHQLRVHLAAIGHPIAGDALYTMNDDEYLEFRHNPPEPSGITRQALHCSQIEFFHPVHKIDCTLMAPLATDLELFIQSVSCGGV